MNQERGAASFEVELKFDVSAVAELPPPAAFAPIGLTAGSPRAHRLEAVYFETSGHDLAAQNAAVRRREGGPDEGWHLKIRTSAGTHEFHWPLSAEPPTGLLAHVTELVDAFDGDLVPIAAIHTERTTIELSSSDGPVAELADDRVRAFDHTTQIARAWREWEAELVEGADPAALMRIEVILLAAGATRSRSVAKIARATGRDRA